MFRRPHHQRIAGLLAQLDSALLDECECLFAGGTAIAMQLDEYRRSDDIGFLCASVAGYRRLREVVFERGLPGLGHPRLPVLRQARTDQYGIRAVLGDTANPVKFEIVREARIELTAAHERIGGVLLLSRDDLFAEKLLANTDRGLDRSTLHRDMIDLCVMIRRWGPIPDVAWAKARGAYGKSIDRALDLVAQRLRDRDLLQRCLTDLDADESVLDDVTHALSHLESCPM